MGWHEWSRGIILKIPRVKQFYNYAQQQAVELNRVLELNRHLMASVENLQCAERSLRDYASAISAEAMAGQQLLLSLQREALEAKNEHEAALQSLRVLRAALSAAEDQVAGISHEIATPSQQIPTPNTAASGNGNTNCNELLEFRVIKLETDLKRAVRYSGDVWADLQNVLHRTRTAEGRIEDLEGENDRLKAELADISAQVDEGLSELAEQARANVRDAIAAVELAQLLERSTPEISPMIVATWKSSS